MILKLAVAVEDQSYVKRLMDVLEDYDNLNLSVFTDKESLEMTLGNKKLDVLLFEPSFYHERMMQGAVTLPIVLLDEEYDLPEELKDLDKINRYNRISQIYRRILELFSERSGNVGELSGANGVRITAFYSPTGGAGKTTVALAVSDRMAAQGIRTCYLSFEEAASEGCFLPQKAEHGLSELLGCLGEQMNYSMKLQGLLQKKGDCLYYLNHFDSPNDFYEMKEEEMEELVGVVSNAGFFDHIVMDLGCSMGQKNIKAFELANRIVLLERNNQMAVSKQKVFYSQMHIMNLYGEKMLRVKNFDMGEKDAQDDVTVPLVARIKRLAETDAALLVSALAQSSNIEPILKSII